MAQPGVVVGGNVVHRPFTQLQLGKALKTQLELTTALVAETQTPLLENPVAHYDG